MASWAQFSQRTTWPPSAAVRQFSIADITFNWPRLTWPALASRQAGPWPRKISATSRARRATRSGRQAGALGSAGLLAGILARFKPSRSSGLVTSRIVLTATRRRPVFYAGGGREKSSHLLRAQNDSL